MPRSQCAWGSVGSSRAISSNNGIASGHLPASQEFLAARCSACSLCLTAGEGGDPGAAAEENPVSASLPWQQCLYFLPLPHGHGSLRPTFFVALAAAPVPLIPPAPVLSSTTVPRCKKRRDRPAANYQGS